MNEKDRVYNPEEEVVMKESVVRWIKNNTKSLEKKVKGSQEAAATGVAEETGTGTETRRGLIMTGSGARLRSGLGKPLSVV